jgi:DNA-binding NtrC family response regulator
MFYSQSKEGTLMAKILVVDDESLMRDLALESLSRQGYDCIGAKDAPSALGQVDDINPDLIVSDFKMPGMTGVEFLREVKKRRPEQAFIIMTAYGTIDTAVDAMKLGASDFIEKPFQPEILELAVARTLEHSRVKSQNKELKKQLQEKYQFIGGGSSTHNKLQMTLENLADSAATVLITGESGVGKEVIARSIHHRSLRNGLPFVKLNCAALPESLIESELFGHEKGAFTGAVQKKRGKFEQANDGTLLLDEIGEMPLMAQAKLLRVLQEKELTRIGGEEEIAVNVRVIATTNRDLQKEVEDGNFREDLFYRLNVIPVEISSLRERPEDVLVLAEHFVEKYNKEYGYAVSEIPEATKSLLLGYNWPGNIRQLENAVERAMVFCKSGPLHDSFFDLNVNSGKAKESGIQPGMTIAQAEKELILRTLTMVEGNKANAAEMLDVSIRTLRNKLHDYGAFEYEREKK